MVGLGESRDRRGGVLLGAFVALLATVAVLHTGATRADAGLGDCGQPLTDNEKPAASDALFVLRSAVGLFECALCVCDLNDNGKILASDALATLQVAVGLPVPLGCPVCTASTTTTTLGCPPADGLDNLIFNEIYSCEESEGGPDYCADFEATDPIRFFLKGGGGGVYEARDVPDDGFVYNGVLDCTTFTWTATEPGEYTESGVWEFSPDLTSFSGSSTYEADDKSYSGACNNTGALSPAFPPSPPPPPACQ